MDAPTPTPTPTDPPAELERVLRERQLRITAGPHTVIVYPRRFSARLGVDVRAALGRGVRAVWAQWDADTHFEPDTLAELIFIGYRQAGMPITLAEAQAHPIIEEWDILGGRVYMEEVPEPNLAAAIVATGLEVVADPES